MPMTASYQDWASQIKRLDRALLVLGPQAKKLGVALPESDDWFELFSRKLKAQTEVPPVLVVGVLGGTNIGKSALFNHMAGQRASAVSPLAAGTRHPVCLVPNGLADPEILSRLFDSFELRKWNSPEDPLDQSDENLLFWQVGENLPDRLVLLDTPDIDSDVRVNWARARAIRQSADLLVAVLTPQKYNDAAVKQFFREAVEAEKQIVVVFNQCDLVADRPYWHKWLGTFCDETGADPEAVYLLPIDREAADNGRLPFYRLEGKPGTAPEPTAPLGEQLALFEFDRIKIRAFRGAIGKLIDPVSGIESYLRAIRDQADEFQAAVEALGAIETTRVSWPSLPAKILVDEIRLWWDSHRVDWSRKVHGFYRKIGRGVVWPINAVREAMNPTRLDPVESMRKTEREAILLAVEKLLDELGRLARVGNKTLRPRLQELLKGHSRRDLLEKVRVAHDNLPTIDDDYRIFLREELENWAKENPRAVRFMQSLDHMAAVARPAISVSLVLSGWVVAGDVVSQAAVQAAGHTASELAAEAAITGGIAGGGEVIVSTTAEGVRQAAGRLFARLQLRYTQQRAAWLAGWLQESLMGGLIDQLREGAEIVRSESYRELENVIAELISVVAAVDREAEEA
jgi:50S ribosome-binding GTPase